MLSVVLMITPDGLFLGQRRSGFKMAQIEVSTWLTGHLHLGPSQAQAQTDLGSSSYHKEDLWPDSKRQSQPT